MRAGLLTETILLQESVPVKNEFGATSMEWVDYLQTRANIKFNSGNRVNQNNEIFTSYTLTFTIRYYHKVNEQMRIIYQDKKYRNALRKAGRILQKETKTQLRSVVGKTINHKNRWDGKTLGSGIKLKVDKKATEAKVHIMGDFRLKFFELGTTTRRLRKNGANRGRMNASHFFRTAKDNKERAIFDNINQMVEESITRISKRR